MAGEYLLVIDDSPTVLKVIELVLTEAGYKVASALDDEAGLTLVREARTSPDLILLDGLIPGRDAVEICRRFAADAAACRVQVVVMAARGQGDDLEARLARAPNVVEYLGKPFSPEALTAIVARLVPAPAPAQPAQIDARAAVAAEDAAPPALAGDLAKISLSQVLELLAEQAHTGVLRVLSPATGARVELYFQHGRLEFAAAVGVAEELLLGRFVVEAGDLGVEALDRVLEERARAQGTPTPTPPAPLLGADLIARGLLSREALQRALARQTSELAYETLRWHAGLFELRVTAELPPRAREAALQINVDRMLLEGYRRVDEWRVIEREISSFDQVFVRDDPKIADLPRGTFTRDELAVLEEVDGRQSLREIMRKLRIGSFDVAKMFFRFRRTRLVRPRVAPATGV
jgi:DNA-binding response OmpR family regulator